MADGSVKIDITADSSDAEKELKEVKESADEAADGLEEVGDAGEEAGKGLDAADAAAGAFVAGALAALIAGIGAAVGALLELADATREYREDMAKLETAFTTQGFSVEAASASYEDFYAILGESDRSVEAVNHLAELVNNEQELAKWSDICAGVTAKFGDSLPIEGLTEAANETAKVGAVTGPLADALNWAGISEEEFNKQLAACNNEQERAALITETLFSLYEDEAAVYNELTASTQEARRATSEFEATQAKVGATVEPLTTILTQLRTKGLQLLLPVIEQAVKGIQDLTKWFRDNPAAANVLKGVIIALTAAFVTFGAALGIAPLINAVKTAMTALNAVLLANPIGIVVAAIAGLTAAFIYFWNTSEGFREFWIELWNAIQVAAAPIIEDIKTAFSTAWEWIREKWNEALPFFQSLWEGIKAVFEVVKEWLPEIWNSAWTAIVAIWNVAVSYFQTLWYSIEQVFSVVVVFFSGMFSSAWAAITAVWDTVTGYFAAIWATIEGIFAVVEAVLSGDFDAAWKAIKGIVDTWKGYFQNVWDNIKNVFSKVATWFGETFQGAKNAISNIWDKVKDYFQTVYDNILNVFNTIKTDFQGVGSNICDGIWAGLQAGWDWLKNKVAELASSLYEAAKEALDINSPSKKFSFLGDMSVEGFEAGFDIEKAKEDVANKLKDLTAHAQMVVQNENARMSLDAQKFDNGFSDFINAVLSNTAGINSLAADYRKNGNSRPLVLTLDGRELGRTVIDTGKTEMNRQGVKLVTLT